jgi:hypothetical protein
MPRARQDSLESSDLALRPQRCGRIRSFAALLLLASVLAVAPDPARADEYEPQRAGHPLRIAAYLLHPIGVVLDYSIFRPAHWLVHWEPAAIFFGHRDQ